jgi:hypothetical protein
MSYSTNVMTVVLARVLISPEPIRRTTKPTKLRKRGARAAWRDDGDQHQR